MRESLPFLRVTNMTASVRFYELLGFAIALRWDVDGQLRWCRLECGDAAMMLELIRAKPDGALGLGVSVCFMCDDALAIHDAALASGLSPHKQPFVGNGLWVVEYHDPDGYDIMVESPTDAPEEMTLSAWRATQS